MYKDKDKEYDWFLIFVTVDKILAMIQNTRYILTYNINFSCLPIYIRIKIVFGNFILYFINLSLQQIINNISFLNGFYEQFKLIKIVNYRSNIFSKLPIILGNKTDNLLKILSQFQRNR